MIVEKVWLTSILVFFTSVGILNLVPSVANIMSVLIMVSLATFVISSLRVIWS